MPPSRFRLPPLATFMIAVGCLGMAGAIVETTLNNYTHEVFRLTAAERGQLEFPRELPGFLTALFAGALLFLPEARMGAIAAVAIGAGMFGLAQVRMPYAEMVLWLFIWSCGAHLLMPVETALAIGLAEEGKSGTRLGQVDFVRTAGLLFGALLVWQVFSRFQDRFRISFLAAAGIGLLASAVLLHMPTNRQHAREPVRFIYRKKYILFYILSVLFGARKQVFITFGPWVLIKVFGEPVEVFGKLWFISAILGLAFKPALGRLIDRLGERIILFADGVILVVVCLGYGYAGSLFDHDTAIYILYACFIVDNLIFAVGMARHTYVSKIAEDPREMTATFSLGISINHAVSMTVPWLGGLLWMQFGYSSVFLAAGVVAVLNSVAALFIRVPKLSPPTE